MIVRLKIRSHFVTEKSGSDLDFLGNSHCGKLCDIAKVEFWFADAMPKEYFETPNHMERPIDTGTSRLT